MIYFSSYIVINRLFSFSKQASDVAFLGDFVCCERSAMRSLFLDQVELKVLRLRCRSNPPFSIYVYKAVWGTTPAP